MPSSIDGPSPGLSPGAPRPRLALLLGLDRALADLLSAWLADAGLAVLRRGAAAPASDARVELVIVDVPFPRSGGIDCIRRVARQHEGVPIVVLSPTIFSGVDGHGPMARALGVACVLPSPVTREVLIGAVRRVLQGTSPCRSTDHDPASQQPD